jgi:hypothetical protein
MEVVEHLSETISWNTALKNPIPCFWISQDTEIVHDKQSNRIKVTFRPN